MRTGYRKSRPLWAGFFFLQLLIVSTVSQADELETGNPANYQARFEESLRLMNSGNCLAAASTFEQLYHDTGSQRVKLEWARALRCLGNYDQSEALFREVLATSPPFPVRARIGRYLDEMETATGKLDYQLGLVRDTNPRAIPTNATVNILGTPLTYTPQFDTSPQTGLSYRLVASRALDDRNMTTGSISLYGIDYAGSDFDINNYEVAVNRSLYDEPRISGRLAVERRYYAGEHLYDYTSLGLTHVLEGGEGRYWKNELKIGTLDYPVYKYLDGVMTGYTTTLGRTLTAAMGAGVELYADRFTAVDTPYAYQTRSIALLGSYQFANGASMQLRLSNAYVRYDSADPFFGDIRMDHKNAVLLTFAKADFSMMGFTPTAEVGYEDTRSTISFYSFSKMTMNLAFRKAY